VTFLPASPRFLKGAIVGIDVTNPLASVIVFQYNPDTLTRTLQAQTPAGGRSTAASRSEPMRLAGPPAESIKLDIEIDATDQLEKGERTAVDLGVYPQLSALEMLIYPKTIVVLANTVLAALGTTAVIAPEAPMTLFVWGPKRVLPVRLTGFSITEEAHDVNLNPIRAKATLDLRVLTYNDLKLSHPGYWLFFAHQVIKETMAVIGSVSNLSAVAGGDVKLVR
jgi:hypothetical protein